MSRCLFAPARKGKRQVSQYTPLQQLHEAEGILLQVLKEEKLQQKAFETGTHILNQLQAVKEVLISPSESNA